MGACYSGYEQIVDLLLSYKASVNITSNDGFTALHKACISGDMAIVKKLIECNAIIDVFSETGLSPLSIACLEGNKEVLELLTEIDPESAENLSTEYQTITSTIWKGNFEVARIAFKSHPGFVSNENIEDSRTVNDLSEMESDLLEFLSDASNRYKIISKNYNVSVFAAITLGSKNMLKRI